MITTLDNEEEEEEEEEEEDCIILCLGWLFIFLKTFLSKKHMKT